MNWKKLFKTLWKSAATSSVQKIRVFVSTVVKFDTDGESHGQSLMRMLLHDVPLGTTSALSIERCIHIKCILNMKAKNETKDGRVGNPHDGL